MKRAKRIIGLYLAFLLFWMNILQVPAAVNQQLPAAEDVQQETQQSEEVPKAEEMEETEEIEKAEASSDSDAASEQEEEQAETVPGGEKEEAENGQDTEEPMLPKENAEEQLISEEEPEVQSLPEAAAVQRSVSNERLDGDYAYILAAGMVSDSQSSTGESIRTGTAPWDRDSEAEEAGNDATPLDAKVRSFDLVSYTTWFHTKMRNNAPCAHYRTGILHFEFVLPGTSSEIQFETESMGWLSAKREAQYETAEGEWQGSPCQILRGSFLLEPNEQNENAIGESYQELSIVIRVLAMKNSAIVQPRFTYWLDYCQVPEDEMVTGSNAVCETHQDQEYKTITPSGITVTAAPRYNIQIKTCDDRAQYVDSFSFDTGNSYAMNEDAGTVYGRIHVLGITVQMVGKTADQGLRGCELPDGNALNFQLDLTSEFYGNDGQNHEVTNTYTPLVWSMEGNDKNDHTRQQYDERKIAGAYKFAAGGAPFNTDNYDYYTCADGGTWIGSQTGHTVSVQVSGYTIDLNQLPYTDSNSNPQKYVYYNPKSIKNYWDVQNACFSAGELWVIQPFYDKDDNYVVNEYGTGTFNLTVQDSSLQVTGQSGQSNEEKQMKTDDDRRTLSMELEKPGVIDHSVTYQKYGVVEYGTSLTDGCYEDGKDWIVAGGSLNIQGMLKHNSAEGMNTGTAYDDLIKFDDAFFVLEGIQAGSSAGLSNMTQQFLYGAKPDGTGWDHKGLDPQDDGYDAEMMDATADDLIFFSSLEELQAAGYVCVAVLWEARGLASSQSTNCYYALQGHVADTAQDGAVYMVTHSAQAWNRQNVQEAAAEYLEKDPMSLTDEDYIQYMQQAFPSRKSEEQLSYEDDYPKAFWVNNSQTEDGLANYKKAEYGSDGYLGGSAGVSYGDSCLVVSFATKITKAVLQENANGIEKLAYDMDASQRVADYALYLSARRTAGESVTEGARITTDLYVEDTLPAGLTYLAGTASWGGTYRQTKEGQQGTITGGTAMEPDITKNSDGTTTLRWTLKDVVVTEEETTTFAPIYYSCQIGTPEDAATDVKNNDQLLNQAIIWASKEQKRDFNAANENLAELSIQVSKNNAISISKTTKTPLVEAGEPMQFTLNIGNNAANEMEMIALDGLPYNGDSRGTSFSGECQVTEMIVKNLDLLQKNLELYYSDSESDRGKISSNYAKSDFASGNWKKLSVDNTTGVVTLPQNFKPVAIAAVGMLPAQETLKIDLTMLLSNGKAGDRAVNSLSCNTLETEAGSSVVSRLLEGVVWLDKDRDGIRTEEETRVNGVTVTLMKLKDGGDPSKMEDYEPYLLKDGSKAEIESGKQMNLTDGTVTSYEDGRYLFSGLPEGTFGVLFTDGSFDLYGYQASPKDVGEDDTIDSDAAPSYRNEELDQAWIGEIKMPSKDEMRTAEYRSAYHDLGLYEPETVPDTGVRLPSDKKVPIWILAGSLFLAGVVLAKKRKREKQ